MIHAITRDRNSTGLRNTSSCPRLTVYFPPSSNIASRPGTAGKHTSSLVGSPSLMERSLHCHLFPSSSSSSPTSLSPNLPSPSQPPHIPTPAPVISLSPPPPPPDLPRRSNSMDVNNGVKRSQEHLGSHLDVRICQGRAGTGSGRGDIAQSRRCIPQCSV